MHTLPGTIIEAKYNTCRQIISSLFETGGLVLSQVCTITGLETHTVQNWVKRGFVSSPTDKKYSKKQFCRILLINTLKDILPLLTAARLFSHINGVLNDESDDLIDDSELYFFFNDLLFEMGDDLSGINKELKKVLSNYTEEVTGCKTRLINVLRIMATAYLSAELKKKALLYIAQLDTNTLERND